jgi:uracil-DNA glycosylase
MKFRDQLHPTWQEVLQAQLVILDEIEAELKGQIFLPSYNHVMRALSYDFYNSKVLIVGQDPYPNPDHAMGLAFSVPREIKVLPGSLKNIFKELKSDLGIQTPDTGDLSAWCERGVVLLNRTLSCRSGESNSHIDLGWREFTEACVRALAAQDVVALLWGANAQELTKLFSVDQVICCPHPSPLSAHRGFLGSKPFSGANSLLRAMDKELIDWTL